MVCPKKKSIGPFKQLRAIERALNLTARIFSLESWNPRFQALNVSCAGLPETCPNLGSLHNMRSLRLRESRPLCTPGPLFRRSGTACDRMQTRIGWLSVKRPVEFQQFSGLGFEENPAKKKKEYCWMGSFGLPFKLAVGLCQLSQNMMVEKLRQQGCTTPSKNQTWVFIWGNCQWVSLKTYECSRNLPAKSAPHPPLGLPAQMGSNFTQAQVHRRPFECSHLQGQAGSRRVFPTTRIIELIKLQGFQRTISPQFHFEGSGDLLCGGRRFLFFPK